MNLAGSITKQNREALDRLGHDGARSGRRRGRDMSVRFRTTEMKRSGGMQQTDGPADTDKSPGLSAL